jgi:hypothetical protein
MRAMLSAIKPVNHRPGMPIKAPSKLAPWNNVEVTQVTGRSLEVENCSLEKQKIVKDVKQEKGFRKK